MTTDTGWIAAAPTHTDYAPAALQKEARAMVRGLGRFVGYEIRVHRTGATLVAKFIRHYNPAPRFRKLPRAIEQTTMAL